MTPTPETIEIDVPVCHTGSSRPMTESLVVVPLGDNRYRLVYSPGVIEGMARGDEFELSSTDLEGFQVLKRAGNLCVWFYFAEVGRNRGPDGQAVRQQVEEFGGLCDGGGNTHLVFSVPVSLGFGSIEALFNSLAEQYEGSSWLYGNVYDPFNDFAPLGWWDEEKS
jgi:hypothetical protein